jgi:hypothetical protein
LLQGLFPSGVKNQVGNRKTASTLEGQSALSYSWLTSKQRYCSLYEPAAKDPIELPGTCRHSGNPCDLDARQIYCNTICPVNVVNKIAWMGNLGF